ncbi:hypothetical protein GQ55_8G026600 [Panicum hallii var. hallii]|uniref:F-box domain-containing protein n=1 Tax=Panicum hallii var. hallii TaxID=1504633 RepID=A0A2T7CK22_9POAL|nr:hypothetical protein GQ55_8G026600 [Panicum hallii var. hallii]
MLGQPRLQDELLVDEILTRLPPAAAARCRAVCRAWNAALTSEHFILAHRARSAAARHPELVFFVPAGAAGTTTSLYTCTLRDGEAPCAARELLTVGNLSAEHAVLSPRPCRSLTLIFDAHASRAATRSPVPMRIGVGNYRFPPWTPFELSSAGLGFDPATGERKAVRLFKKPIGEMACEVCTPGGSGGWRPCAGRVPPPAASFVAGLPPVFLGGSLLSFTGADQPIMSFSVGAEQFGWVPIPLSLARRIGDLAELDGSLCAVVDRRINTERCTLFTWSGGTGTSWSMCCSINSQNLPRAISDEFVEEQVVIPLCSGPARLLLNLGLHEESIVGVHQRPSLGPPHVVGGKRLQVKMGVNTVGKRKVPEEYRDGRFCMLGDFFKELTNRGATTPFYT